VVKVSERGEEGGEGGGSQTKNGTAEAMSKVPYVKPFVTFTQHRYLPSFRLSFSGQTGLCRRWEAYGWWGGGGSRRQCAVACNCRPAAPAAVLDNVHGNTRSSNQMQSGGSSAKTVRRRGGHERERPVRSGRAQGGKGGCVVPGRRQAHAPQT